MKWLSVLLTTTILLLVLSFAVFATPTPVITSVSPSQGLDNQRVSITINGAKFYSKATTVKLTKVGQADIIATNVVVSKTTITCDLDLQGKAVGTWDVVVTNIGKFIKKQRFSFLAGSFTIDSSAPTIKSISPVKALNDATTTLDVTGTNLRLGAKVSLVNNNQVIIAYINDVYTSLDRIRTKFDLTGVTPGEYDVLVNNTDGSKAILPKGFTVVAKLVPTPEPTPTPTPVATPTPTPVATLAPISLPKPAPVDPNTLFKSIFFDFDKYTIRMDQKDTLKTNLEIVKKYSGNIVLGGHADERGPNNYNIQLSAKRAEAVKRFLVANGIKASRIIIYAYGETSPKLLGHNEESWQYNRRVDIALWTNIPTQKDALKK